MLDNKLEIIITAKDEATPVIKKVSEENQKATDKANSGNESIVKGLKAQMQPMKDIITTVSRVGLIWSVTLGAMVKSVLDLGKEIDNLDKMSYKLGISTSDLSKKFYGFDISTKEARVGVAGLQNFLNSLNEKFMFVKLGITSLIGENEILIKQYGDIARLSPGLAGVLSGFKMPARMSRSDAITELEEENKIKRAASETGRTLLLEENDLANKFSLSKVEYTRKQFDAQLKLMEYYGVNTVNVRKGFEQQELSDKKMLLMQLEADALESDNRSVAAFTVRQNIQMAQFKKLTNDKTVLMTLAANQEVALAKKVRDANMANYKAVADGLGGLSNSLNMYAAENKKMAKTAQAISLAMAIVYTAMGVAKAFSDYSWPYSIIVGALVLAAGAVQIATISSQSFHKGGMVRKFHDGGLASDEVPATLLTGEGVVNRGGMSMLGAEGLNRLNSGGGINRQTLINIEINNPQIRNDDDIDKLTQEISLRLARESERL